MIIRAPEKAAGQRFGISTARLMGIIALWGLLLGIAFQPTPAAYRNDHMHFGIYKLIAASAVAVPLFGMLRKDFGPRPQPVKAAQEDGKRADEEIA